MRFLCLVHMDETILEAMAPTEERALEIAAIESDRRLEASGNYLSSQALDYARTARIARWRDGRLSVTDGPFIETREQLGGFILIEARDLDEAVALAAKIPMAWLGAIEVRPVKELLPPE